MTDLKRIPEVFTWEGRPFEDLTKDELIEAITYLAPFVKRAMEAERDLSVLRMDQISKVARNRIYGAAYGPRN